MNKLLNIKLKFEHEKNTSGFGKRKLKKKNSVDIEHIDKLINDLNVVKRQYSDIDKVLDNILVDVYYNDTISKSGRIMELFKQNGDPNDFIVGARFDDAQNHIITYYVSLDALDKAIVYLNKVKDFLNAKLDGKASELTYDDETNKKLHGTKEIFNTIIDCSVITSFKMPNAGIIDNPKESMVITFYNTELNLSELFEKIKLDKNIYWYEHAGKNTISAPINTYEYLIEKVPYLISMVASDISIISPSEFKENDNREIIEIPSPKNEPTIGVIDTLFDTSVYFNSWVDYREKLDLIEFSNIDSDYYEHGTAVSSLIVDGPTLNPRLDDGLGRFKVRHFGVCPLRITPTKLINRIETIIKENKDIHVWNLSLGTSDEISKNFISFDGAALDKLQQENNIIFVISGTNDARDRKEGTLRIGSPADSLNSLVVNSVRRDGTMASYSRSGKVLSFFNKPDVSYYGGDFEESERISVYTNKGLDKQYGTSYAAPWISRKMCYLIDVLGLTREVAKALIIDSAAGWAYKQETYKLQTIMGYGIVPKKIEDVLNCDNSEIRFILQGVANTYTTANYALPVPKDETGKCPYVARATLCYFPECSRLEGVDYTQRELSLKLGRVTSKGINDINKNIQDEEDKASDERRSRNQFRKWDNTKLISSLYKEKGHKALSVEGDGYWGVSLTSKERRRQAKKDDLSFGLVVTLKNIKGVNKINEFKHACLLRSYIVNEINIENQIDIYQKAQEEVKFE